MTFITLVEEKGETVFWKTLMTHCITSENLETKSIVREISTPCGTHSCKDTKEQEKQNGGQNRDGMKFAAFNAQGTNSNQRGERNQLQQSFQDRGRRFAF
jgi:hypothetical protein